MFKRTVPFCLLFAIALQSPRLATASSSMVGGKKVAASDWIAHTVVALVADSAHGESLCTASLVASDLAITAAHCVTSEIPGERLMLSLIFGQSVKKPTVSHIRTIDRVIIPAEWRPSGRSAFDTSDVALLHFSGGLPSGFLPSDLLRFDHVFAPGQAVELAGYGISNALHDSGAGILRKVEVTVSNPYYSPGEIQLDQSHGGAACHGDSGGPAYIVIAGHPYLFGITSRGGGQCNQDVIYTKIAAYQGWFEAAVNAIRR